MAEREKHESSGEGRKKKKHLHEIRTVAAHDGTYVHHHTYKAHKDDPHAESERMHAATSQNEEEAGQHVAEQFAQNGGGSANEEEGEGTEPEAQPAAGGAEPQEGE